MRGAGGGTADAGTDSSETAGSVGAGVGAGEGAQATGTGTGDVGRTMPLLRGATDRPVTTRTDTGDFGSSSVNKNTFLPSLTYTITYILITISLF